MYPGVKCGEKGEGEGGEGEGEGEGDFPGLESAEQAIRLPTLDSGSISLLITIHQGQRKLEGLTTSRPTVPLAALCSAREGPITVVCCSPLGPKGTYEQKHEIRDLDLLFSPGRFPGVRLEGS
jgi:hypothetical protein